MPPIARYVVAGGETSPPESPPTPAVSAPAAAGASITIGCATPALVMGIGTGWAFWARGTIRVRMPFSKLAVISAA
jgi:hypothetical protein